MQKFYLFASCLIFSAAVRCQDINASIDTVRVCGFCVYESSRPELKIVNNSVSVLVDAKRWSYFVPLPFNKKNELMDSLQKLKSRKTNQLFLMCSDFDVLYSRQMNQYISEDCLKIDSLTKSTNYVFKR